MSNESTFDSLDKHSITLDINSNLNDDFPAWLISKGHQVSIGDTGGSLVSGESRSMSTIIMAGLKASFKTS